MDNENGDALALPDAMAAVVLNGYGGIEQMEYRTDVPVPTPGPGQALVAVSAAGMNNTDINTRIGWYNPAVHEGTTVGGGAAGFDVEQDGMGEWGDISFPRIQGADVSGTIVACGAGVAAARIGERVVADPYVRDPSDAQGLESAAFLGAAHDGGFAQFCAVPAVNLHTVPPNVTISDAELATLPCSAGTAMNMMLMARVGPDDTVLVTGASGGVGTFLIQIGVHLGADVIGIAAAEKHDHLLALGARAVVDRSDPDHVRRACELAGRPFTVIADVVGGDQFESMLSAMARGGRYVTAGAIAGPIVQLDLRTVYLKSLEFYGSSSYRRDAFPALMRVLAEDGLRPVVHRTWPLSDIAEAQRAFLEKTHVGNMVLLPPPWRSPSDSG